MMDKDLIRSIEDFVGNTANSHAVRRAGIGGLTALCARKPTRLEATIYDPVVCLILQGSKETWLGDKCVSLAAGDSLIVSHHLPVVSRIVEASSETPYVALVLSVDMGIIRNLYDEVGEAELERTRADTLSAGTADKDFVEAMTRLFNLTGRPSEAKVMEPLIRREIHFRLLIARHGAMLRKLLNHDSSASRVARAINRLRQDYKAPISVPELARTAGMSTSSFHEHFKLTTSTTPLQYQKDLRLIEARRLLADGSSTISNVAFEVGYESPTQFSREYSRKFGMSPREHMTISREMA